MAVSRLAKYYAARKLDWFVESCPLQGRDRQVELQGRYLSGCGKGLPMIILPKWGSR